MHPIDQLATRTRFWWEDHAVRIWRIVPCLEEEITEHNSVNVAHEDLGSIFLS